MASGDRPNIGRKPSGRKADKLGQEEQSKRFKEAARELGVDESGEAFERALDKITPSKRPPPKPKEAPVRRDEKPASS